MSLYRVAQQIHLPRLEDACMKYMRKHPRQVRSYLDNLHSYLRYVVSGASGWGINERRQALAATGCMCALARWRPP